MDLEKRTYVDGSTIITAENLNDIQDAIIDLEQNRSVPTSVRSAIYTLLENCAYITTGLDDEIAVVQAWAEQVYSLTLNKTSLSLNQETPQTITATVVPSDASVSWSSSDTDVATVSDGVVTGVANGSCVITATAGALSATCAVTVSGFATLESISAVYTQSGVVYFKDSLDSLKTDLVVTATYSDTTTATIPSNSYTLSGTLEAGTSTITVTYRGKTDTFDVTVSLAPSGYTEYDYVKYIGATDYSDNATAYNMILKTNSYSNLNNLIFDFYVSPSTSVSSATNILGGQSATGADNQVSFYGRNDTQRVSVFSHGTAIGIDSIPNMTLNSVCHVRLEPGTSSPSTLKADSLSQTGAWTTSKTINHAIGYCGVYGASKAAIKKFASVGILRLYDLSETLVGEYIPCVRDNDSVIGVWDTVTETFYTANTATYATVGNTNCVWAVGNWSA